MDELLAPISQLLAEVILPNLKSVQTSQAQQISANDRLEHAIKELRRELESQFANLSAQLTACRMELAATQAMLKATRPQGGNSSSFDGTLIH